MAETGLYYPYMRIEDEGWLRATLLLFDQVQRIVPQHEVAGDSAAIRRYIEAGLLGPAPLYHEPVRLAQKELASSIEMDARSAKFRKRFSEERTLKEREEAALNIGKAPSERVAFWPMRSRNWLDTPTHRTTGAWRAQW